jgi:PKD repeat protein/nitrous oxidase accessory protein NosD
MGTNLSLDYLLDRRRQWCVLAGLLLASILCSPGLAATITVCPSGCNYTSIQDAINHAADGDTIEIHSGQYYEPVIVNRSLILNGIDTGTGYPVIDASGAEYGVTLESPGIQLSRLNITGANSSAILLQSDGASLRELTIVHPKVEPRELTYPAVTGENVSGLDISSCTFLVRQDTVVLYDPHEYSISHNTFLNPAGYSVAIISSGEENPTVNGIIVGNSITQERGAGIGIIARSAGGFVDNLTIADNTISGAGGSIGLFIPSRAVVIRNNTLTENPGTNGKGIYGIMTYGTSGVMITDNSVQGTDVELAYRFESCTELNVSGNAVDGNSDTGIGFLGVTDSFVSRNTMDNNVYNFWMSPLVLDPGELPGNVIDRTNLVDGKPVWYFEGVEDLSVDGSDDVGTLILYACNDATIRDLSCTANGAGILAIRSENVSITNCSFRQMYQGIMTVASPHLTIRNNHLTDCFDGLMIGDFHDGLVSGNHIENSGDCGIVTGIYLEDVNVSENVIEGAVAGLFLDSVSGFNNAIFSGNTINNTLVAGISTSDSEGVVFSRNYLDPDSGVGFDISYSSSLNITGNTLYGGAADAVLLYNAPENSITSNILNSNENGFILQRKQSQAGSQDNMITNNLITSPEPVRFCLRGGVGEEPATSKFSKGPETPLSEIPSITLISSDDTGIPADFACNPDPSPPQNTWNVTKTSGTNIAGGPFLGGNYWAKPNGTGWSQVTPDRGDGFCNAPFIINADNTDYLPLHTYAPTPPLYADFTASPLSGQAPLAVQFTDRSTGIPLSRQWNFGDSPLTFPDKNPVHVYQRSGTFSVSLLLTNFNGTSTAVKTGYITVIAKPKADFLTNVTSGFAPLTVKFNDTSTESPTSWLWDFGDGYTSAVHNPVHTYTKGGTYTIRLTASNAAGSGSMTKTDYIVVPIIPVFQGWTGFW